MNAARLARVYDSPDQIIPDRPKKPVRGRAARLARYRAENQKATGEEAPKPRKPAVEVYSEQAPEPGPIVWAKPTVYDIIPYCLDQPRR